MSRRVVGSLILLFIGLGAILFLKLNFTATQISTPIKTYTEHTTMVTSPAEPPSANVQIKVEKTEDTSMEPLGEATYLVQGIVLDNATGKPIAGAEVWKPEFDPVFMESSLKTPTSRDEVTITNSEGVFSLNVDATHVLQYLEEIKQKSQARIEGLAQGVLPLPGIGYSQGNEFESYWRFEDEFMCMADGYARSSAKLEPIIGATYDIEFRLIPGYSLSGRVIEKSEHTPAVDVLVQAKRGRISSIFFLGNIWTEVRTDAEGFFRLRGLPSGMYKLTVKGRQQGYAFDKRDAALVDLASGLKPEEVVLHVSATGTVYGYVTNGEGVPHGGVTVKAVTENYYFDPYFELDVLSEDLSTTTDETGFFEIPGLVYGTQYRLTANKETWRLPDQNPLTPEYSNWEIETGMRDMNALKFKLAPSRSEFFSIEKGESHKEVNLVMRTGCFISGTAVYSDGSPGPGYMIEISYADDNPLDSGLYKFKSAEEKNAFKFGPLAAGTYLLGDTESLYSIGEDFNEPLQITVDGRNDVSGLRVILSGDKSLHEPVHISGIVLDTEGKPANNVEVQFLGGFAGSIGLGPSLTREDGRFMLSVISEENSYNVIATSDTGYAEQLDVKPGSDIQLKLGPPAMLRGEVVDSSGTPVSRCPITLYRKGGTYGSDSFYEDYLAKPFSVETGPDGTFTFENVVRGTLIVQATHPTLGNGISDVIEMKGNISKENIRIVLDPGFRLGGIVSDKSGQPISGVQISLVPKRKGEEPVELMLDDYGTLHTISDATGRFVMEKLPSTEYFLQAKHADFAAFTDTILLSADTTNYRIVLMPGGELRGRYITNGEPVRNAKFSLLGDDGVIPLETDTDGYFEASHIVPGLYIVNPLPILSRVQLPGDRPQNIDINLFEIKDGYVTDVSFARTEGVMLGGVAPTGLPGVATMVTLRNAEGSIGLHEFSSIESGFVAEPFIPYIGISFTSADGTYEFTNVPDGEYVIDTFVPDLTLVQLVLQEGWISALGNIPKPQQSRRILISGENLTVNLLE